MNNLPMPSDLRKESQAPGSPQAISEPIEPPSVKLIVRLFVIPLIIVALAVGVMFLIGLLAGGEPSVEEAIARLKAPGGERTADYLVGPASKQRYLDAKTLVDKMKSPEGMSQAERIGLASQLIDILNNHTHSDEGEVQHFVLLALGRTWQKNPAQAPMDSPDAVESRRQVLDTLLHFADSDQLATRKAAVLSTVYLAGYDEAAGAIPKLIEKLGNNQEDLDVRIAAATVLGPLASDEGQRAEGRGQNVNSSSPSPQVIAALQSAMRNGDLDSRNAELAWSSALSLAELNQADVSDRILKLLSRDELSKMEYYDRETDPKNPTFRKLNEEEQQRILINTMLGAKKLNVPAVQEKLRQITQSDPSPRVRAAGMEMMSSDDKVTR